jgi:hypothetical protein
MRFHDFHLSGYSVRKFGGEIVLHLIYDDPPQSPEESHIRFSDVEFYHFVHTGGAIILDIAEVSLSELLDRFGDRMSDWNRQHGISRWHDDRVRYQAALESDSLRAWEIGSAVGFAGVVIAKTIQDVTSEYHQPSNQSLQPTPFDSLRSLRAGSIGRCEVQI